MATAPTTSAGVILVSVGIVVMTVSWLTLALRVWVRVHLKAFGLDDILMVTGLVIYSISAGFCFVAIYHGIGTLDKDLNLATARDGLKWFWFSAIIYPPAALAIKCSICMALLRFARDTRYRIPLHLIMILSGIAAIASVMTWALQCRPVTANWDPTTGKCASRQILVGISYYQSANSIVTDWACAILPGFILWDVQLKMRIKVSIICLLAMGVIASTATIIRLAYITAYVTTENYMYHVANIALWSNVEIGFGLVAGSAATFRPLFRYIPFLSHSSRTGPSGAQTGQSHPLGTVPGNATRPQKSRRDPDDIDAWDTESQKHILKETNFQVSVEQGAPPVEQGSRGV